MTGTVVNVLHVLTHFSLQKPQEVGNIIIPILPMMKLGHREFNDLPKVTRLVNARARI